MIRALAIALLLAAPPVGEPPALIVVCKTGGILFTRAGSVALGGQCVMHDKTGRATSVESIAIYDTTSGIP